MAIRYLPFTSDPDQLEIMVNDVQITRNNVVMFQSLTYTQLNSSKTKWPPVTRFDHEVIIVRVYMPHNGQCHMR